MIDIDKIAPYAPTLIKLCQGVLYNDDNLYWDMLIQYYQPIRDYFNRIGLELHLHETEGFAFLSQPELNEHNINLPRLTRRIKLSYDATLLCVLLVERLIQFETSGTDTKRLILTVEEIREMVRLFFQDRQDRTDEVRLLRELDRVINQVKELGFLKLLRGQSAYEVRPVLKAKFSADKLAEIKGKLQTYVNTKK